MHIYVHENMSDQSEQSLFSNTHDDSNPPWIQRIFETTNRTWKKPSRIGYLKFHGLSP